MKVFRLLIILCLVFLFSAIANAQGNKYKKANATFEAGEYLSAIDLFKDAYEVAEDKAKKTEIVFKIAECYRHLNEATKAELWFKKTIDREYQNPLIYLYYANALKTQAKYKDAEINYRKYKELVPDDIRGENGLSIKNQYVNIDHLHMNDILPCLFKERMSM